MNLWYNNGEMTTVCPTAGSSLVDLVHGRCTAIRREAVLSVLGASQSSTEEAVEMSEERTVTHISAGAARASLGYTLLVAGSVVGGLVLHQGCCTSTVEKVERDRSIASVCGDETTGEIGDEVHGLSLKGAIGV
jgi:hypothetical protein